MRLSVTSLRLRLILAFSALVSLILFVGVVAYGVNEQVRTDVAELRASGTIDLRYVKVGGNGLEIEGYWNPGGAFVATKVTQEPMPRRHPLLRGTIQSVSTADHHLVMYGIPVLVTDDTRSADDKNQVRIESLRPGMRAELTCAVDNGNWRALKVQLDDIKPSDKIKGTATKVEIDGVPPETIEIHRLKVVLEPQTERGTASALSRIAQATRMLEALQDCRAAAHVFVESVPHGAPAAQVVEHADAELRSALDRFDGALQEAQTGQGLDSAPARELMGVLDLLTSKRRHLRRYADEVRRLRDDNPAEARPYLASTFGPFLDEMLRYVYSYLDRSGEQLRDEIRDVQGHTETTTRVALGTCGVAVAVALVLGILVWRSVHRPIQVLHDAALALGEGRLDTRVAISSRDEMGVLADAFNKMAGQLEATTVSVTSLENMFASMAAGVILCDQQGRITNANRAAQVLLDRERGELAGLPFAAVCPGPAAGPGDPPGSVERAFLRRDGTGLPVSLSVSELRSAGGALQGKVYVAQDLTPMKRIEARLRESLGEKELLLREVHHRVKNNMQVISSLLAMQSTSGDPQVRERLDESQHRIRTIALIHEQLYQSTEVAHIDVPSYLDVLANHLLQTFGMADRIELVQDIAPLDVDLDQSLACGLIVNELLTNALKYAFPDHRRGTIRLSLREGADGTRVLEVADDGRGMPPPTPGEARKTLGTSLVAQLARQLRGRVEIDGSQGTTVRIVFARQAPVPTVTP